MNSPEVSPSASALDMFERGLIRGGAKWIADLTEFFRDYKVAETSFTLYARGRTRNSGFMISRFFAWTVLPNYSVSLFCIDAGSGILAVETLKNRVDQVTRISKEEELQWAWLVFFSDRNIQPSVVSYVTRYDKRELGIGVGSTASKQLVVSDNQIGRSIEKHLRLGKAIGAEKAWKH